VAVAVRHITSYIPKHGAVAVITTGLRGGLLAVFSLLDIAASLGYSHLYQWKRTPTPTGRPLLDYALHWFSGFVDRK
jgi:hypothetical protein